jgi:hypothetical protein
MPLLTPFVSLPSYKKSGEGWDTYMYDAAAKIDGCVTDPEYDSNMCGFNDFPGCSPLNGCGSSFMFPFLITYVMVVTLMIIGVFVGMFITLNINLLTVFGVLY